MPSTSYYVFFLLSTISKLSEFGVCSVLCTNRMQATNASLVNYYFQKEQSFFKHFGFNWDHRITNFTSAIPLQPLLIHTCPFSQIVTWPSLLISTCLSGTLFSLLQMITTLPSIQNWPVNLLLSVNRRGSMLGENQKKKKKRKIR